MLGRFDRKSGNVLELLLLPLWLLSWSVNVNAADPNASSQADPPKAESPKDDSTQAASRSADFSFIKTPPGQFVALDHHRLHVDCQGDGDVTVLFEAGLGGSSLEWLVIRDQIATRATSCVYDRSGYGWSDPSPYPRHVRQLAIEVGTVLNTLALNNSVILVGHSYGGLVIRELALRDDINVLAMVLIDSSHEDQFERLQVKGAKAMVPSGKHFILSHSDVPENLPEETKRKIKAFSRMRKTTSAIRAELSLFKESAAYVKSRRITVDYPVVVVSRGVDQYADGSGASNRNAIWQELQADLLSLSRDGRFVRADNSGHHVHADDPQLIIRLIEGLLDEIDQKP